MASGRKPIFSVEKSLDFTTKVENHYLLTMSGLAPCRILGSQKQIAELNDRFRLRFDIAGAPKNLFA